jgi:7 transmembrane sweet-taste receptor of 3 GCPR
MPPVLSPVTIRRLQSDVGGESAVFSSSRKIDNRERIQQREMVEENSRILQFGEQNTTAARGTLLAGILGTRFQGASGIVDFGKEDGKERDSEFLTVGLYNIRPENFTSGRQNFFAVLVSTSNNSDWTNIKGTAIVYRDGTTIQPRVEREYTNENYLSLGVRTIGLVLMGIAWMLSFSALVLLRRFGKDNVVLRAQPFFLKMLCVGSIVMSTSIFTLSWDEGAGWSDRQLDIACAMTPWFFFIGQILTFCALFTKLWRVDKVLQFRRRAVTVSNVMGPLYVRSGRSFPSPKLHCF